MIFFKKLTVRNFLSIGNRPVEFLLDKYSTTLVVGENGCGKSQAYTDAITYVLFNKPFRNINKPNLVNSINQKDCVVEIEFSVGNVNYLVRRGMKPNIFEIYKDGVLLDQEAKAKDYQSILEKSILGMNYRAFTQIVILGSASFTPFMQLPAAARREVIEEILEIQVFSVMHGILKTRIAELKDLQKEVQYKLDLIHEKIKMNEEHQSKMVESLKDQNKSCETKIQECKKQIEAYESEISDLESDILSKQKSISHSAQTDKKHKEYSGYLDKINSNMARLKREISFFEENENCPTCNQKIDDAFKENAVKERLVSLNEIGAGTTALTDELNKLQSTIDSISKTSEEITNLSSKISSINHKILAESQYISKLQTDIQSNISRLEAISEGSEEDGAAEKLDAEKAETNSKYKSIAKERHYADISYKLLKDTGIKTKIIRQYLPLINKLVNEYLAQLNFAVSFTLDEEFKESIKSRFRDNFSYESFSEGEKARINIALLLTWREIARRKNSAACNLLVMDETLENLDSDGAGDLIKIINTFSAQKMNTIVISHKIAQDDSVLEYFDTMVKVTKAKNFSQYEFASDSE